MARGRAANYAEQQQGLLHHAAQLFAERGFQGTSMLELASAAGVSKALLYHYYENKEQLLYDILLAHFERIEAAVEEADDEALPPHRRARSARPRASTSRPSITTSATRKVCTGPC